MQDAEEDSMKYNTKVVLAYFKSMGIPDPETEYKFCVDRKWRFDFAWPVYRVALECEGGVWTGGRHTSGSGFVKDMEKYNFAVCDGWAVLRCVPRNLCMLETAAMIHSIIRRKQ